MEERDVSRWVVVYPIYLNSKKTIAEGRRIPLSLGCEDPTISEIVDCCAHLKLDYKAEPEKAYSRDFMQRGRVRVQLRDPDMKPLNPEISSKNALLHKIAQLVPGRRKREQASGASAGNTASSGSSKGGKGGKRKK